MPFSFQDEFNKTKMEILNTTGQLDEMKEQCIQQKKRVYESLQTMIDELGAIGNYSMPPKVGAHSV